MKSRLLTLVLASLTLIVLAPEVAHASGAVKYGVQDDAWLASGPGTLEDRLDQLERLGVGIVRYTIRWDDVAAKRPRSARSHRDRAYNWKTTDAVLRGLRARGIEAVVTIYGAPRWANGRRGPNWAPNSGSTFASFSYAAAKRYSWVRRWLIWNEPNQRLWLRPTTAATYVRRLLNPAYAALHSANRRAVVGGGVTAPRGNAGGIAPVDWIQSMRAAGARLDAYAHNPYPLNPRSETPTSGGCIQCRTITMATLERLLAEVQRSFGSKRIWLTEYGYQTNPPDRWLGVSPALQARYHAEAALRAYQAPRVDMLIYFLVRDEPIIGRWQSGVIRTNGAAKPSYRSFILPLAQAARSGSRTTLWAQVRPRRGVQTYRLQQFRGGRWQWVGGMARTSSRGFVQRVVRAERGAKVRIWSPRDRTYSPVLVIR